MKLSYIEKLEFIEKAKKNGFKPKPFHVMAPEGENVLLWEGVSPGDIANHEYQQAKCFLDSLKAVLM